MTEYRAKRRREDCTSTPSYDIQWGINTKCGGPDKQQMVLVDNSVYAFENELHFTAGINKDTIQQAIRLITKMVTEHLDKKKNTTKLTITYIVDSPGGSVSSVLKFVDFLNLIRSKYDFIEFVSIISGISASAGTIMAIVADKSYITKNADAMIHELSSGLGGKFTHMMSYSKHLDNLHNKLVDIYMKKVSHKMKREEVENLLFKESWFSATQYYELGFVDGIKG